MYDSNLTLIANATQTSSTNGTAVALFSGTGQPSGVNRRRRGYTARVLVQAVSGTTPVLDVIIKASTTSGGTFNEVAQQEGGHITAPGEYFITFTAANGWIRADTTIGGTTPSFQFQVDLGLLPQRT